MDCTRRGFFGLMAASLAVARVPLRDVEYEPATEVDDIYARYVKLCRNKEQELWTGLLALLGLEGGRRAYVKRKKG